MRQIASIEMFSIIEELKGLEGLYLKKFYDLGNDSFRMNFSSSAASMSVYIKLLRAINVTTFVENADEPTQFITAVRKRIMGMRLKQIRQYGTDRIVIFEFECDEGYKLIFEMFAKGNVVLIDKENKIELAYKTSKQKERSVTTRGTYSFPSGSGIGFDKLTKHHIEEMIGKALKENERLMSALSKYIDLGPLYLEDAILASNADPKGNGEDLKVETLAENILKRIENAKNPMPLIYKEDEKLIDYAIMPIKKYESHHSEELESVSRALEIFYMKERVKLEKDESELREIKANIEKQKRLVQELQETEKNSAAYANKIFENMVYINSIINYINEKRRVTLEELQAKFTTKVKSVDLKKKSFVIEL